MRKFFTRKSTWLLIIILFILAGIIIINKTKALPEGISMEGKVHYTDDVTFLTDLTYQTKNDKITSEQEIFKAVFQLIEQAEEFVIVDMFLFNDYTDLNRDFPDLSGDLTAALIAQKAKYPDMQVVFITDPINTGYYSYESKQLKQLKENGIEVVLTSLSELRDSNTYYSAGWRMLFQVFGQKGTGWVANSFAKEAPKMTARSYLYLLNVKANHRKVVVSENNALITTANPHNESGFASNIAFKVSGDIIHDIVASEQAVINYSGGETVIKHEDKASSSNGDVAVQYLTEGKILKHLIQEIDQSEANDTIWIGMFYIADREIIDALHRATDRDVKIQMILDPNKVAFGNAKIGLPNLPVASEMIKDDGVRIRWYESDEDQYHTKLLYIKKQDTGVLIGGSANHTTRNLADLNLENNIKITATLDTEVIQDVDAYFNRLWNNENGIFTSDYETHDETLTPALKLTYWVQKVTGLTTY